jgi:hypothetical protein
MTARVWLILASFCSFGVARNIAVGAPSAFSWMLTPLFTAAGVLAVLLAVTVHKHIGWITGMAMIGAPLVRLLASTTYAWREGTVWTPETQLTWAVWLWVALGAAVAHTRIVTPWLVTYKRGV